MTTMFSSILAQLHTYAFLLVLVGGLLFARGGVQRNIWSLRYLWHDSADSTSVLDTQSLTRSNPRGYVWQAQEAFRTGDFVMAERLLAPLITANQFNAPNLRRDTMRLYGAILAETGRVEQALSIWRDVGDIDSLQGFAGKIAKDGNLTTALRAYEMAYKMDRQAGAHQFARFLWNSLQEPSEAEAVLRQTIEEYPYSGEQQRWLHLLGQIYKSEERWEDAHAIYGHLVRLDSSDVSAALQLGSVMTARGDGVAQVMAQYQAAVAIDPNKADGYYAIAQLLARSGEYQLADPWFLEATSRNPNSISNMLAYAANARDIGDSNLVLQRYRQLQTSFADQHRAHVEAAWIFHGAGLIDEAKQAMDTALRLAGSNPPQWYLERADKIYNRSK